MSTFNVRSSCKYSLHLHELPTDIRLLIDNDPRPFLLLSSFHHPYLPALQPPILVPVFSSLFPNLPLFNGHPDNSTGPPIRRPRYWSRLRYPAPEDPSERARPAPPGAGRPRQVQLDPEGQGCLPHLQGSQVGR